MFHSPAQFFDINSVTLVLVGGGVNIGNQQNEQAKKNGQRDG